jgi:hypothetical protein
MGRCYVRGRRGDKRRQAPADKFAVTNVTAQDGDATQPRTTLGKKARVCLPWPRRRAKAEIDS